MTSFSILRRIEAVTCDYPFASSHFLSVIPLRCKRGSGHIYFFWWMRSEPRRVLVVLTSGVFLLVLDRADGLLSRLRSRLHR